VATNEEIYTCLESFLTRLLNLAQSEGIDALVELDLSFTQARTVFVLAQSTEPVPINVVADRVRLSVAGAGRTVDGLVGLGLVERRESTEDRRVKLVSLTSEGERTAALHFESKRQGVRKFVDQLPPELGNRLHDALVPILTSEAMCFVNQERGR